MPDSPFFHYASSVDAISTIERHAVPDMAGTLIGTHSRVIEGDIQRFLLDRGWTLEMGRACIFGLVDGRPQIQVDGVQGWVNGSQVSG